MERSKGSAVLAMESMPGWTPTFVLSIRRTSTTIWRVIRSKDATWNSLVKRVTPSMAERPQENGFVISDFNSTVVSRATRIPMKMIALRIAFGAIPRQAGRGTRWSSITTGTAGLHSMENMPKHRARIATVQRLTHKKERFSSRS